MSSAGKMALWARCMWPAAHASTCAVESMGVGSGVGVGVGVGDALRLRLLERLAEGLVLAVDEVLAFVVGDTDDVLVNVVDADGDGVGVGDAVKRAAGDNTRRSMRTLAMRSLRRVRRMSATVVARPVSPDASMMR